MAEFKQTKITLCYCLILVFHVTAVTGQRSFYVRDGDNVTLRCDNKLYDCGETAWNFNHYINEATVGLVARGQIASNECVRAKADRLSVGGDCSLMIKKVTLEDIGLYTCRAQQYMREHFDHTRFSFFGDPIVYLSLVKMSEQKNKKQQTLSCSVVTYGRCSETLRWLYDGVNLNGSARNNQIFDNCLTTVSFATSDNVKERFQCKVTDTYRGTVKTFDFTSLSSVRVTKETMPTNSTPQDCSVVNYVMLALRAAELFLITVVSALLFTRWRTRPKGKRTPPADNIGLHSVSGPPGSQHGPAASQVHNDDDDDDGDVTYVNAQVPVLIH